MSFRNFVQLVSREHPIVWNDPILRNDLTGPLWNARSNCTDRHQNANVPLLNEAEQSTKTLTFVFSPQHRDSAIDSIDRRRWLPKPAIHNEHDGLVGQELVKGQCSPRVLHMAIIFCGKMTGSQKYNGDTTKIRKKMEYDE